MQSSVRRLALELLSKSKSTVPSRRPAPIRKKWTVPSKGNLAPTSNNVLAACKDRKTLSGYMCQTGCYYSALVCILADPPIFHKMSLTNLTCSTPVTSGFPFRTALRTLLLMQHTLLVHSHKKPLLSLSLCMLPLSLSTHTRTPSPRHTRKGGVQRRHSSAVPSLSAA